MFDTEQQLGQEKTYKFLQADPLRRCTITVSGTDFPASPVAPKSTKSASANFGREAKPSDPEQRVGRKACLEHVFRNLA